MDYDEAERERVNPFDWPREFPEIMKAGGFDCVIGNPPYIPIESMTDGEKEYYTTHWPQLEAKYDSAAVFILAFLPRLCHGGRLGYISSVTWQTGEIYRRLRETVFERYGLARLVNLPFDVFKGAYVDTGVYVMATEPSDIYWLIRYPKKARIAAVDDACAIAVPRALVTPPDYKIVLAPDAQRLFARLCSNPVLLPLGDVTVSTQGLAAGRFRTAPQPEAEDWMPFLVKGQVDRYSYGAAEVAFTNMSEHSSLRRFYDAAPKVLIRRLVSRGDRLLATYSDEAMVLKKDINPFVVSSPCVSGRYLLGIVNSRLMSFLYLNTSSIATKDDFRQTTLAELRRLPIRPIDFSSPADVARHDHMVALVQTMLDLHQRLPEATNPKTRDLLTRQIADTDAAIDRLVYELYELTDEEIVIVEGEG
jgi:hypothetical protein